MLFTSLNVLKLALTLKKTTVAIYGDKEVLVEVFACLPASFLKICSPR